MSIRDRTTAFCDRFGLRVPILLALMAGASAPALSIAVANAGGLGACGALLMARPEIVAWANYVASRGLQPATVRLGSSTAVGILHSNLASEISRYPNASVQRLVCPKCVLDR